jgi:hypothetical protein
VSRIVAALGGAARVDLLPIPLTCVDGFGEAYYGRPEFFLDPGARKANSAWSFVPEDEAARSVEQLRTDLASGAWDERHGHLRSSPSFDGALILVVAD